MNPEITKITFRVYQYVEGCGFNFQTEFVLNGKTESLWASNQPLNQAQIEKRLLINLNESSNASIPTKVILPEGFKVMYNQDLDIFLENGDLDIQREN